MGFWQTVGAVFVGEVAFTLMMITVQSIYEGVQKSKRYRSEQAARRKFHDRNGEAK